MASKRPTHEEEPKSGPAGWIVSFSDMVTLLLAFFVLLQAFASVQDPELFYVGQGSFRRAINGLGIPSFLHGHEDRVEHEHPKIAHPTESDPDDPAVDRISNPEDNEIRIAFKELTDRMRHEALDVQSLRVDVSPPAIRFAPGEARLDAEARNSLKNWLGQLRSISTTSIRICVVGLAENAYDSRSAWILSAKRAGAVAEALRDLLASDPDPAVRSWRVEAFGAAHGNEWCREKLGLTLDGGDVGIATLREDAHGD